MALSPEEVAKRKEEMELRRKQKAEERKRRFLLYFIIALIALILAVGTFIITYRQGIGDVISHIGGRPMERINILILGSDAGEYDPGRTDTIVLATFDPVQGQIGLLSIPRDTRVAIPGRNSHNRINAAYAFGGAPLAKATVESFIGVKVDYYVVVDFAGFKGIVDTLGGVEINVERRMRYDDFAQGLHIDLRPGVQVLDGEKALHYIRYRDSLGDIALIEPIHGIYGGRVQRQQRFLQAVTAKILQPATLTKIPSLVEELKGTVQTNLPLDKVVRLSLALKDLEIDKVPMAVVPGIGRNVGNASYWVADEEKLKTVVDKIFYGVQSMVTVEVLNGNGRSGLARQAADKLQGHGYQVVNVGNATNFDYLETQVLFRTNRRQAADDIAILFSQQVRVIEDNTTKSDITVIVGRDLQI